MSSFLLFNFTYKMTVRQMNIKNMIDKIDDFIAVKNGDKYLNIASTDRNSEVLKNYSEVWN